ncbi:MAG: ABC transporter substrate-binding protein [Alphaproteobacteria bacterium]|nr:ABC transporter substrate-binding protein [Alphaproteobacteria bacterium]
MRSILFALALLFCTPFAAFANTQETAAKDFVLELFERFREIYAPNNPDAEQQLLRYYDDNFDHQRIARFIFGSYIRRASQQQFERFSELLPKFVFGQISPQIEKYFSAENSATSIKITAVRPLKKQHVIVHTRYTGPQETEIRVRLRPNADVLKILDVQIAGISMLLAQRDLIGSMIKQNNGDLNAFLDQLKDEAETSGKANA